MQEMTHLMNMFINKLLSRAEIAPLINKAESDVTTFLQSGDVGNAEYFSEVDLKKTVSI